MMNTREIAAEYRLAYWSRIMEDEDRATSGITIGKAPDTTDQGLHHLFHVS